MNLLAILLIGFLVLLSLVYTAKDKIGVRNFHAIAKTVAHNAALLGFMVPLCAVCVPLTNEHVPLNFDL
jgi:archaellum component FlaF (FlaF/FlaG flagellin family)